MVIVDSVVRKGLEHYYSDKYFSKKFEILDDEEKKKVENALKKVIPGEKAGKTSASADMATMGYRQGAKGDFAPPMGNTAEKMDNSGYRLVYDSFTEGLEPIYYWVLDYMRDTYWGTGLEVSKTMDKFESSVGSGFFGDLGTRASIMQDRAMKLMTTINAVTRSVLNILYDLKEFDQRLEMYRDLESDDKEKVRNARLGLKQFWMDRVDIQRGRGSINMLAQQLQFVTLRDAFMVADSVEDIEKGGKEGKGLDLNERVKRILKSRISDYLVWESMSGKEITRRYTIERSYLKSQVESLKLYAQWAKPYFQAASKLESSDIGGPDLVSTFNTLQVQASLLGTREAGDFFIAVEVGFDFRSIPHTIKQTQAGMHYTQGGKVDMQFRAFALSKDEKEAVEKYQFREALEMAKLNDDVIKEIDETVEDYLNEEEKEYDDPRDKLKFLNALMEKTKEKDMKKQIMDDIKELKKEIKKGSKESNVGPFDALFSGVKEIPKIFEKKEKPSKDRGGALKSAVSKAYQLYNVYKKAHNMYTE